MMISMAPHYEEVKNSGKLSSLSIFFFGCMTVKLLS